MNRCLIQHLAGIQVAVLVLALSALASGVSTDSAVRQIQANIDDWQNEQAKATPERDSSCRDSRLIRDVWKSGLVPSPEIELPALPKLLDASTASSPISAEQAESFVSEAFQGVVLIGAEKTELAGLESRKVSSDADALELEIGAQQLAIAVSNRIYSTEIETYYERALVDDSYSTLDGEEDTCNEDTLRLTRDGAMIAASQTLLGLYQSLSGASGGND